MPHVDVAVQDHGDEAAERNDERDEVSDPSPERQHEDGGDHCRNGLDPEERGLADPDMAVVLRCQIKVDVRVDRQANCHHKAQKQPQAVMFAHGVSVSLRRRGRRSSTVWLSSRA
jgi:hypothetical protein